MKSNVMWWQNSVIYQIYPKSFQDTTGSGTGDLLGIIKRLKYIKLLGVDAIWLTPFYVSPQVDHGYDVSDYLNIDPMYGNLLDFDNLVEKAHKIGIKIIIDMVFNHSSTQHKWFCNALNPNSIYRSYYIWKNPNKNGGPPNNWKSKFGGKAWTLDKHSNQYYLHLWTPEQADLNWENNALRAELKKIVYFWAKRGIDGLRLDVVNLVSKPQDYPNDRNGDGSRLYTDGPKIHKYMQEMNKEVFTPLKLMTVGEMSSTTLEHCKKYSSLTGKELSMVFNFDHVEVDFLENNKWTLIKLDLVKLKSIFSYWQKGMHKKAWNALFWCNHDQPRIVSRWGNENYYYRVKSAKLLAIILHGMQGTPYIYQGEEIGMTNPNFNSILEYRDVETHNMYKKYIALGYNKKDILKILSHKSRDNGRTPMQWNDDKNGGFTQGNPWIKIGENFKSINVEKALSDKKSIFYTYKKLINLRKKYDIITWGNYKDLNPHDSFLWCYLRQFKQEKLLVLGNFSKKTKTFYCDIINTSWNILIHNYSSHLIIKSKKITLRPYEAIFLHKIK